MLYISAYSCVKECSHGLVWVEHNSDSGSDGSWWKVLSERSSDGTGVSVGVDDLTPHDSISSVVHGVLGLEDIGNSLSLVESGTSDIGAVLDGKKSLVGVLTSSTSSESGESSFLIKSDWLGLVIILLLGGFDFLWHSSLFVIMIIQ